MSYTPELRELIKKVEATRPQRLGHDYPRMTPEEKQDVLRNHHPDYIQEQFREALVGPNKGERFPHELADVLEAYAIADKSRFDIKRPDRQVDVLVIGGGGGGAAASLMAHEAGADVMMATKLRFGDANTVMAQGGIQAADKPTDSPATHYLDVMGGGHYTNIPELVKALVSDAPDVISWLENLGCMFDKDTDGTMKTKHGGGTSRMRMHSARDYTGAEIMRTLRDEVICRDINVVEFCAAVELLKDHQGKVGGAVLYNMETEEYMVVKAKTVILATGGLGRLHTQNFPTSNHYGATADGLVLAYRAGAKLAFMDTVQYHPTGASFPEQVEGFLITEKVRGLGATPINIHGEKFVYHLETRDVEASAIIRECDRGNGIKAPSGMLGVWLDSPMIEELHGEGTIEKELPAMYRQFARFGVDIRKDPILVYPTLHYQNGGVLINDQAESTVENLFVAGEVSGGIHGRNRLMGNSLLDILVMGRRAGRNAAARAMEMNGASTELNDEHVDAFEKELKEAGIEKKLLSPILIPLPENRNPRLKG
ncbi:succinate dehydrogenase / fumarate reductase flavoprotein subunit [Tindallia magadiensis]|uniref:Succinate dehydrogenase / fumarate reductase flavoprotein subunit n=1 Tax=Tindallia magadiensis TaxID=69895 RepID=A0A1I3BAV6_9FIRM|nr:FAD-binding protein [Tindallia magadiensis]SFH59445.1 succinate dehydrogenase / fumarate reductase flavoprotein subunit [Tindallia magadiensis]